jgi:hypothetical protein
MLTINGVVYTAGTCDPVSHAKVKATPLKAAKRAPVKVIADAKGRFTFTDLEEGDWTFQAHALGIYSDQVPLPQHCAELKLYVDVMCAVEKFALFTARECSEEEECLSPVTNKNYTVSLTGNDFIESVTFSSRNADIVPYGANKATLTPRSAGPMTINAKIDGTDWDAKTPGPVATVSRTADVRPGQVQGPTAVALQRSAVRPVSEQGLWTLIRANSRSIGFERYALFIDRVLCQRQDPPADSFSTAEADGRRMRRERNELTGAYGVGAYELLRTATELFLLLNCRVSTSRNLTPEELAEEITRRGGSVPGNLGALATTFLGQNAYIQNVIDAAFPGDGIGGPFCDGVLTTRASEPCLLELIWSYWHEEGMLVQSVNALGRRFQNIGAPGQRDPLSHFELDPLRPLNNILWGYVQEEYRRLTVPRRSLEYSHHYGLSLIGRANRASRSADPRSKFLESFHNLLHRCSQFFKEDNDTTVIADGFPLLNALKEVHLILAQGAHNQFGDLPWTARVEMLIQQWIMARGETRDFLQSRAMVPYTEAWMPQVDTMKTVQGWTDVGVGHFRDLGAYGEQLLLSIRYGNWIDVNDEDVAKSWARYWRPEVQSYLHSYRAVAGVDLSNPDTVDFTVPAVHLKRRLDAQVRPR